MDEIPEDVWEAAESVGQAIPHGPGDAVTVTVGDIARAILAERERCALVAEASNAWPQEGADIARDIRNPISSAAK